MEKLKEIINIVRDNKGLGKIDTLKLEDNLMSDLGLDSLDLAELTVRCEQAFGIDIFDDGIVTTIKEVMDKLNG